MANEETCRMNVADWLSSCWLDADVSTVAISSHFPFAWFSLQLATIPGFAEMQEFPGKSTSAHR